MQSERPDSGSGPLESIDDGYYEADLEGRLIAVNPALCRLLGRRREDLLGRSCVELVRATPEDWYRRGDGVSRFEWEVPAADGGRLYLEGSASVVRAADGAASCRGIVRDVTERRRASAALDRARDLALVDAQRRSEFVTQVSHDLRTPMSGILGMCELALETELTAEQREYLTAVRASAQSLLTLVNDILDFSRIDAGRFELERIAFSLRDCLADAIQPLSIGAHRKGLELLYGIDPAVPATIVGDPTRLRQILANLIDNAIKYTSQGQVVLRVDVAEADGDTAVLRFRVADTGSGIPAELQQRIFDPFVQAAGEQGARAGGTGLGLAISQRLVGLMGGRIWVESEPRRGSVFGFTVRLTVGREPARHPLVRHESLKGLRVLLADGNATSRQILADGLRYFGLKVDGHATGESAWHALEAAKQRGEPHGVAAFDVLLPDWEGFDLARRIHDDAALAATRVILLTRSGQRGDAALCRRIGVSGYLSKPIHPLDLLDTIRAVLGASAGESAPVLVTRHSLRESKPRLDVLVAEDDPVHQLVIRTLLERGGHVVTLVDSGEEALEAASRHGFDLVLMDLDLPRLDGFAASRALRAREAAAGRRTPIVALSAHSIHGDDERLRAAGIDGHLGKPFEPGALFSTLERFAPARGGAAPTDAPQRPAGEPAPRVVDRERLLEQTGGDLELLRQVVAVFLAERPAMLDGVRAAVERRDAPGLARAAHRVKGTCATLSARLAAELAAQLECVAGAGELGQVAQLYEQLERSVRQAESELRALVGPWAQRRPA